MRKILIDEATVRQVLDEMRRLARFANVDHTENKGVAALEQVITLAEQPAPVQEQTKLEQMWESLAEYQSQADANGHGESWAVMCSEKTSAAADAAAEAAADAAYVAAAYVATAAYAVEAAADAAAYASAAVKWAHESIDHIKEKS